MPPQMMIAATDPRVVIVGRHAVVGTSVRFDWPATELRLHALLRAWPTMLWPHTVGGLR